MRKFFLLLFVFLSFSRANVQAQTQANIFAYALKASVVNTTTDEVDFTYSLNADASSVIITVSNGNIFSITDPGKLTKAGSPHTVTCKLTMPTEVGDYTWSVKPVGAAASTNTTGSAQQITVSPANSNFTFTNARGVAVNDNPESPYFGYIYTSTPETAKKGIWASKADYTAVNGTAYGAASFTNGSTASSPMRLSIGSDDDLLYITDWSDNITTGVYIMDQANPTNALTAVFGGTYSGSLGLYTGIHGSIPYAFAYGTSTSRKLYTIDEDYHIKTIKRYDIGTLATKWTTAYSAFVYDDTPGIKFPNATADGGIMGLAPDRKGSWWMSQYRWAESSSYSTFYHLSASGTIDFESYNITNPADRIGRIQTYHAIATNRDGSLLALFSEEHKTIKVYSVTFNASNVPSLSLKASIVSPFGTGAAPGSNALSLAFDYADNLYAIGSVGLKIYALPNATADDNTVIVPAPITQQVKVKQPIAGEAKTFTVTVPNGTEHVYIAGSFTDKNWNIDEPYELQPTGNLNEFSGTFPCVDGVQYKYLCELNDWDYQEGEDNGFQQAAIAKASNRSATGAFATDEVPYWYHVKKINFEATFAAGVTVPNQLSVLVIPVFKNGSSTNVNVTLTKSGAKFTGAYGGNTGDKFKTNSQHKYFIPTGISIWENRGNRFVVAPKMNDVITDYDSNALSGDYYIPNGAGQRGWSNLKNAFTDINIAGIVDSVTLNITSNITEDQSVGLTNNTNHSIMIKPDKGVTPVITFSKTTAQPDLSGAFIIGCGNGLTWSDVAPGKNIILDGLTIKTATTAATANLPLVIIDACENITVKNCLIQHQPGGGSYAVYLRGVGTKTEENIQKVMPKKVTIENSEIINNTTNVSAQAIGIFADADMAKATGIVIKNNKITARTRGVFMSYVDGINITGNTFRIIQTSGQTLSEAIYGYKDLSGKIYVANNKFIELKTANLTTGAWGIRAVFAEGGEDATWYIENNYFAGFDKTAGTGNTMMQAICLNSVDGNGPKTAYILHNTFYLSSLTNKPTANIANPEYNAPAYCAIEFDSDYLLPVIQNNLFVSAEDDVPNFFIRGDIPSTAKNNVFYFPASAQKAKIASGNSAGLKTVSNVVFTDAQGGDLSLSGASKGDKQLSVPLLSEILKDIYGTDRQSPKTYAGAFEAGVVFTGITTSTVNGIKVICLGNQITVISDCAIQSVKLLDLQGRTIEFKQNVTNGCLLTAPAAGIYLVEIWTETGPSVHKVVTK